MQIALPSNSLYHQSINFLALNLCNDEKKNNMIRAVTAKIQFLNALHKIYIINDGKSEFG